MNGYTVTVPSQLLLVIMVLGSVGLIAWAVVAWKRLNVAQSAIERPTDTWTSEVHRIEYDAVSATDDPDGYRKARGVVRSDEAAEDIIRRIRNGEGS